MDVNRINELIKKYINGTSTPAEEAELNNWYRETANQDAAFPGDEDEVYQAMLQKINQDKPQRKSNRFANWRVAASIFLLISVGIAFYVTKYELKTVPNHDTQKIVSANPNRATLILADGKEIDLNQASKGQLATQGNISVTKAKDGQLIYTINNVQGSSTDVLSYNTIKTPVGAQYQVVLPDQSKVWLNAMSTLKFPVSFNKLKERRVELSGEGYFEVTHNSKQPFRVISGALTTEDLGTEFNVKAYADDAGVKTTLVKGAASVTDGKSYSLLHPGEQAAYHTAIKVSTVNLDDAIAWKNGYFRFDDEKLEDIMKNISRWYDIQYVFQDQSVKAETYGVVATRFNDISVLLKMLEQTGNASFAIYGKTVLINRKKK